jgi:hypothetical protein
LEPPEAGGVPPFEGSVRLGGGKVKLLIENRTAGV